MDPCPDEEKLLHNRPQKPKKGGLRTIPFIIVNESFERLASTGLTPNMVFYLRGNYNMEVTVISTIFSLWSTLSNGLAIFGAAIADSYWGRFPVIVLGSFSSLLGMTGVWLTAMFPQLRGGSCGELESTCRPPNAAQLAFLIFSFVLISIGAGCVRPCSMAFGIDQLDNKERPNKKIVQGFINWYGVSSAAASVIALTVIVYIQDHLGWKVGFGMPAILMLFSAVTLLLGSSFYIHVKPSNSVFIRLLQVVVVAWKNRNISLPPVPSDDIYHQHKQTKLLIPTDSLRCLNKACIVKDPERDLNPDGSASNPWNLCTVEQVEALKAVLRVIPMWSTGIVLLLSMYQNSYSTLQANSMNRHIIGNFEVPAASFSVVMIIVIIVWLTFYDRVLLPLLARFTGNSRGISVEARMGISLILSALSMVVSALVERQRRKMVVEKGLDEDQYASIDMSALWLFPQYVIMGVAEAMATTSHSEFFYIRLPKNMSSIAMSLYTMELSAASAVGAIFLNVVNKVTGSGGRISWLASNINKGHVDYYYWLIAFMGFLNFFYFLICLRAFPAINDQRSSVYNNLVDNDVAEEEQSH